MTETFSIGIRYDERGRYRYTALIHYGTRITFATGDPVFDFNAAIDHIRGICGDADIDLVLSEQASTFIFENEGLYALDINDDGLPMLDRVIALAS